MKLQKFWNFLCDREVHVWKKIPTSMIDPWPWRRVCRNCGASPKLRKSNW